jgi:hypothetical protein
MRCRGPESPSAGRARDLGRLRVRRAFHAPVRRTSGGALLTDDGAPHRQLLVTTRESAAVASPMQRKPNSSMRQAKQMPCANFAAGKRDSLVRRSKLTGGPKLIELHTAGERQKVLHIAHIRPRSSVDRAAVS